MGMLNGGHVESGLHHHSSQSSHHLSHSSSSTSHQNFQRQLSQQEQPESSRQAPTDLSNVAHLKRSDYYFMSDELRSEIIRKNLLHLALPTQELVNRNYFCCA